MKFVLEFPDELAPGPSGNVYLVVDDDKKWGESGGLSGNSPVWLERVLDEGPDVNSVAAIAAIIRKHGREPRISRANV